jgi:hypothetical protein
MKRGIHPDSWFTAADFTPEGRTLVISKVEPMEIEPNKTKLVVYFKDELKGLVLNEVNHKIIAKNTGQEDSDDWIGYHITLYNTSIKVRGENTSCIRVKILVGDVAFRSTSI